MSFSNDIPHLTNARPFDVIVVISPDVQAARAVHELIASPVAVASFPLSILANGVMIISTFDPHGCEMGTGGGTVAALAEADEAYAVWQEGLDQRAPDSRDARHFPTARSETPPTVLILHAKSRRFSAQIALGTLLTGAAFKALPVGLRKESPTGSDDDVTACAVIDRPYFSQVASNPVKMLIHSLSAVFDDVPIGSVVVVTDSDIILSFNDSYHLTAREEIDFDDDDMKINFGELHDRNCVVGLAVPFPARSVKNERVHVLDPNPSIIHEKQWQIQPTSRLLQLQNKPRPTASSINREETATSGQGEIHPPEHTFYMNDQPVLYMAQRLGLEMTWVDAHVIAFLPSAAGTLRELSQSALRCYTRSGLEEIYQERYGMENLRNELMPSIEEFAREASRGICIYGDILSALSTSSSGPQGDTLHSPSNSSSVNPLRSVLQEALSERLSQHTLHTCAISTGSIAHLGSAGQLTNYLTSGVSLSMGPALPIQVSGFDSQRMGHPVTLNCLPPRNPFRVPLIGGGSVLEHCHLDFSERIAIGERCLVSGLRGPVKGSSLRVPLAIGIQLLPLFQSHQTCSRSFVCVCLGVDDEITGVPPETLFGLNLRRFLQRSGLAERDLWDDSIPSSERTLWNARINPVLSLDDKGLDFSFLDWIGCLKESDARQDDTMPGAAILGLRQWLTARRLSLSEIRASVDCVAEVRYRSSIPFQVNIGPP